MYGIGVFEILLILLVLMLFLRPEEIFSLFRRLGTWFRRIRKAEEDLRKEWDRMIKDEEAFGFDLSEESDKEVPNDDRKQ